MPNNIIIDTSEQGTEEWKQVRLGKFTASKAGDMAIMTKQGKPKASRQEYITQLALERLTNEAKEMFQSQAMIDGIEREATAALTYSFIKDAQLEETGFWYFSDKPIGASPDRKIVGMNAGIEIKSPMAKTHLFTLEEGQIPEYYRWQIIQQLLVTGWDYIDYVSYHPAFPENANLYIERVERTTVQDQIDGLLEVLLDANDEVDEQVEFIRRYSRD